VIDSYISVGKISGVFGHRGWVKVIIYSARPDRFEGIKVVYFKNKEDYQAQILTGIQFHGKNVLLKLKNFDDRETAKSLNNLEIFLPETEKISLPEDQFFIHDIIGTQVFDETGQSVGEVKEVIAAGSSDVFVVWSGTREILIPAVAEFVLSVDLETNRIVIRLWEDM
jgi:16S rRNA processing protein RimM